MAKKDGAGVYYERAGKAECLKKVIFFATIGVAVGMIYKGTQFPFLGYVYFILTGLYIISDRLFIDKFWFQAEEIRRKHSLENAYNINITGIETEGYYNNTQKNGVKKYILNQLESLYYTMNIVRKDFVKPLVKLMLAAIVALAAIYFQQNQLFELVLSTFLLGYLGIELWEKYSFLKKLELLYKDYEKLLLGEEQLADIKIIKGLILAQEYEAIKCYYKIQLDSKIYQKYNDKMAKEWEDKVEKINFGR